MEALSWNAFALGEDDVEALLVGDAERKAAIQSDWVELCALLSNLREPALRALTTVFLRTQRESFCRAAAARGNHHARRGGLLEHTTAMLRMAAAVCESRTELDADLLLTGVLFHDCGKMVENQYELRGVAMPFTRKGELLGHITIGVDLVRTLWQSAQKTLPEGADPARAEQAVDALCHLVLSHHGQRVYGSPVEPKMPEAVVLHGLDQMDAQLEMMRAALENEPEIGTGVVGKRWPLSVNLVKGLA